jgi:hypothetical protein
MTAYWWYIAKVSICLVVFYTLYTTCLKNCTFFLLNRIYLVLGLLLSFIIPVLKFSIFNGQSDFAFSTMIHKTWIEPEYDFFQSQNLSTHDTSINFLTVLSVTYFFGISILFFKLLFSIIRIRRIKHNAETYRLGNIKIVKMDSLVPFSFFNMIFLPKNENNPMIVEHEMAHIKQLHWVDLILTEIASVLLWMNPFVILYKSSLKLQHEYLADARVVKDHNQIEHYLGCMLKRVQMVSSNGLVSHFYCKTIKKRIVMITKNRTSIKYAGMYLLSLPIVCLLLAAFTSNYKTAFTDKTTVTAGADEYRPSICPIVLTRVTHISNYGERIHPITRKKDFHYGIDFAVPEGEKIMSAAKGIVAEINTDPQKGNYILIVHNKMYSTFYTHLKSVSVKAGEPLEKGQVIGYVGNTGISTGPHLHYEVIENGVNVDPKNYISKN